MLSIQKLSVLVLGAAVFACSGENPTEVTTEHPAIEGVSELVITPESVSVNAGQTIQLKVYGRTAAGDSVGVRTDQLSWTTTDAQVATVSQTGLVTSDAAGSVTISALTSAASASARVKVTGSSEPASAAHAGWHVTPSGTEQGSGARSSPWNLSYALNGAAGRVQPGDTIWLHSGTYRGEIRATVAGASGRPVVIRQYPGERATYDAKGATSSASRGDAFVVKGQWTEWWDFEITNSDPNRHTDTRSNMLVNAASNTKYINLVVHDGGIGFYNSPSASNVEISGSIFYNNGWQGTAKGGGHAMYLKSYSGPVLVRDNVTFDQFGYGIHVYTDKGAGQLVNITIDGNVSFNNGTVTEQYTTTANSNILVGGEEPVKGNAVKNNMTYFSAGHGVYNVRLGYAETPNVDVTMSNNYVVGGKYLLTTAQWDRLSVTGNQLIGGSGMVNVLDQSLGGYSWSGNKYQRDPSASAWQYLGTGLAFAAWKSSTGLGGNDAVTSSLPTETKVFVRPNAHENGRAMVVVYNWGKQSGVSVDLSNVLPSGAKYEVRNVQNWFGSPVATGTFSGGSIQLPMSGVTAPTPIGGSAHMPTRTGPDFDTFIVRIVK